MMSTDRVDMERYALHHVQLEVGGGLHLNRFGPLLASVSTRINSTFFQPP